MSDRRQGWTRPLSAESSGLFADTREDLHFSWTVVVHHHASFTSKCDFFILMRSPLSIPRSSPGTIAPVWFGAPKSMSLANHSKPLSLILMHFPSPLRSQPSPSGEWLGFSVATSPLHGPLCSFSSLNISAAFTHTCHTHFSTLSTSNIASISKESKGFSESMKVDVHNGISDSAVFPGLFHFLQVIPS